MRRMRKKIPTRLLSVLLAAIMLIGALPFTAFAVAADAESATGSGGSESCTVIAHGGIIKDEKTDDLLDGTALSGTAVRITLDETAFEGHTFVCWRGDDGSEIPQKSFRLLVERDCAFYPVFSDLKGSFGDWQVLSRGELCTDGVLYVREDLSTGLKEYRFKEENHTYQCEEIDDNTHRVTCAKCPYTDTENHSWDDGSITTEATHTEDGVKTYTCYNCKATKTEVVPAKTDEHSFLAYPDDDDWVIIKEPDGMTTGLRTLKCSYCDKMKEPVPFIRSKLPDGNIKLTYKQDVVTYVDTSSREEEHYISDNAYFFYINRKSNPYDFGILWIDEGINSPVYIRSDDRYGTAESKYYGILCYVDNRQEFLDAIQHQLGVHAYNNGRDTAHMYSIISGYRAFETTYNELLSAGTLEEKMVMTKDYQTYDFWDEPLREYKYTCSSIRTVVYYVDKNNACIKQIDGSDVMQISSKESFEEFPYAAPDRDTITYFNYYVYDGRYGNVYYDGADFGMASPDWSDEDRRLSPTTSRYPDKVFDHWERLDPRTGEWRYLSDDPSYVPSVSDVTVIRAVFRDKTYHIKVNGGYYKEVVSGDWTTGETKYTEGDIKAGTRIFMNYDSALVPEGKEFDTFVDAAGNRANQWLTPDGDEVYTATFTDKTLWLSANPMNGVIYKDGASFWGEKVKIGESITLTTQSAGEEYPYFLGWYILSYDEWGNPAYELLSADTTLTYTIPDENSVTICARWHSAPELTDYNFTVHSTNGFLRTGYDALAVSDLRIPNDLGIIAIKDPNNPLILKRWKLTGTMDDGSQAELEIPYEEPVTWIYLINDVDGGGKGGDGKTGEQRYPWNVTITGEADICAEHSWNDGVVTKEPTHADYGEMTYTCTVCGTQKTEAIPMLARCCVHACAHCGKCVLDAADTSCEYARCTCESSDVLPTQNGPVIDFSCEGTGRVYTVLYDEQPENPYVQYVLSVTDGYDIEKIYDISFTRADASAAGDLVKVTLTVGTEYAQAIADGRMHIIHIAREGNILYGVGHNPVAVNVAAGTVAFEVSSFSPFVLVRSAAENYTVSGAVTSFGDDSEKVTMELISSDSAAAKVSTEVSGNNATYSFANVASGTYTLKVMKKNHVTREYTVTVGSENVLQDVKIHLLGDINGDGSVDMKDWGRMRSHINKTNMMTDNYALACADITKDGKVDMKDWGRMRSHINKANLLW